MKKRKHCMLWLTVHIVLSFTVWGTLRVMQRGYNATHREQLAMANLSLHDGQAVVRILDGSCEIPITLLEQDSPLYYVLYCMTDSFLHLLVYTGELCFGE